MLYLLRNQLRVHQSATLASLISRDLKYNNYVMKNAAMAIYLEFLCDMLSFQLLGHTVIMLNCLLFWGTFFQSSSTILRSYSSVWGLQFLHILSNTCYRLLFTIAITVYVKCRLTVVLICVSVMVNDVEHLSTSSSVICICSLEKRALRSFAYLYFYYYCKFF